MVIHKLQFLFIKSTVTIYRQWEIEQKQPVQMADTKTNETRNREVNSLYRLTRPRVKETNISVIFHSWKRHGYVFIFMFISISLLAYFN